MKKILYHFTNDTRFKDLSNNLFSVAKHIQTGKWDHQNGYTLEKAKNGLYPFYEFYFGLTKNSNNIKLILDGKKDRVIAEAIKKFQYPNPKSSKEPQSYKIELERGELIAPQRIIVKLLLYMAIATNDTPKLSLDSINKYILANEDLVFSKGKYDIAELYSQIKSDSQNYLFDESVELVGGTMNRFSKQLCGIMSALESFEYEGDCIKLKNLDEMKPSTSKLLLEIASYNEYWRSNHSNTAIVDYADYLQADIPDDYISEDDKYVEIENTAIKGENVIFYGAPGTGKSYNLTSYIQEKSGNKNYTNENLQSADNIFRITLYPEYEYADFVGQLLPKEGGYFEYKPGIFTLSLKYALEHPQKPVFMILEEMSRSNIAAVFGDLFQLLDRKDDGFSEYAINNPMIAKMLDKNLSEDDAAQKVISIPANLYIVGTVNTSDQNVFVMDTAFKRRFRWEYRSTDIDDLNKFENNPQVLLYNNVTTTWYNFYTKLNEFITDELGMSEDKQIGPYFVKFDNGKSCDLERTHVLLKDKLLQYLWEDVESVAKNSFSTDKTIFNPEIKNFSTLYTKFQKKENIFSKDMLVKLHLVKRGDGTDEGSTEY